MVKETEEERMSELCGGSHSKLVMLMLSCPKAAEHFVKWEPDMESQSNYISAYAAVKRYDYRSGRRPQASFSFAGLGTNSTEKINDLAFSH